MAALQVGPAGIGVIAIGTRALSESGTVGDFAREQVELFCVSELVNTFLDADEEFIYMDSTFPSGPHPMCMSAATGSVEDMVFGGSCVVLAAASQHSSSRNIT